MPKASPWNRLASWSALPERRRRQARVFAFGALAGVLAAVLPWEALFLGAAKAVHGFQERRSWSRALAPMVRQAERLDLSYDAIRADPAAHLEKPVVWCVDTITHGHAYYSGRPSQPILWTNGHAVPRNSPTSGGRCTTVLAVVEDVKREGVVLRFVGLP